MFSLGLPSDPSLVPSPLQGQNGKTPNTRLSMGPLPTHRPPQALGFSPRHTLEAGPSGRPANELLGSATFQTPEGDGCCLDVISMEGFGVIEQWFKVLSEESAQLLLTAFLQRFTRVQTSASSSSSCNKWSGQPHDCSSEPGCRGFHAEPNGSQTCKYESQIARTLNTVNAVGNPSDAAATLAQERAKLKAAGNAAHQIAAPALALAESVIPSAEYRLFWSLRWFCLPLPLSNGDGFDRLFPVVGDSWASILNDLYGSSNVPPLDSPDKFHRPSKGVCDSSSGSNNGVTDNSVYGDDGNDCDFIQGHHAPGVGRVQSGSSRGLRNGGGGTWSGAQSPALSNTLGRFGGNHDRSNAMAAAHQQAALVGLEKGAGRSNLRLGSPGLAGILNGMNPFNMNMSMLNLAAIGVTPKARLLAAQIAPAGGGIRPTWARRRPGAAWAAMAVAAAPGRPEGARPYMPNVEGMTWEEMVVMDEQGLEAQGVAALGARRKMLKTFEVSGGPAPGAPGSISGGSAGSGGGLSA
ncbi:hypothetical protein EDB89DRAFT_1906783 [Lactarius sanguifluus]|nr:hypothetical protein EDB89DRAFT_1906783 [Lactarius sanguifluus]